MLLTQGTRRHVYHSAKIMVSAPHRHRSYRLHLSTTSQSRIAAMMLAIADINRDTSTAI